MAAVIDICNLALAYLGDTATVVEITPPEGSVQAEHCARFYPIARDSLLEMHTWDFATRRVKLAEYLPNVWPQWRHAYSQPTTALNLLAVLPPDAMDDYTVSPPPRPFNGESPAAVSYMPQPFACERNYKGDQIILTNQSDAILRYTGRVDDPNMFSPLFVTTLAYHLASMLAGPLLKGDAGAAQAKACAQMVLVYLAKARESDSGQRRIRPQQNVPWMAAR